MTASYDRLRASIVALEVFWSTKPKKPKADPDPSEPKARPPEVSYNWRNPPVPEPPVSAPCHLALEVVQPSPYTNQPDTPEAVESVETSVMVEPAKDEVTIDVPVIDEKSCV